MIYKLSTKFFISFLYLISLLPFRILFLLSDILYVLLYYIIGYRKQVVNENLKNSFPSKSEFERNKIAKDYFKYLCDLIVETIKMITINEKQARNHFKILNPELLEKYTSENRNIIVVAGHYGNWEMANVISFCTTNRKFIVYKPLTNRIFDNFMNSVRSKFVLEMVPMKNILRKLASHRNEPTITILVSDQTPVRHEVQYYTNFLNQKTAVFLGVEKIAKMNNSVVLFFKINCVKRGFYEAKFEMLEENPSNSIEHEITEKHVKFLENIINIQPRYWLWSHKRWKF